YAKYAPLVLLLMFKLMYVMSSELLSIIIGYAVFVIGDRRSTQVSSTHRGYLVMTACAIVFHYLALHYLLTDLTIVLYSIILQFQPYSTCLVTFFYIVMNDLAIKHISILSKAVVVSFPERKMSLKRRERLHQFIEYISLAFRCILPAPWWIV
ncbi:hypothetical protein PMAYCL1PPCAC_27629, partial [Pristionchus mayeri]